LELGTVVNCPKCGSSDVKFTGRLTAVRKRVAEVIITICDCYVCRECLEEWADFGRKRDKVPA
jgi:hypothetical protein